MKTLSSCLPIKNVIVMDAREVMLGDEEAPDWQDIAKREPSKEDASLAWIEPYVQALSRLIKALFEQPDPEMFVYNVDSTATLARVGPERDGSERAGFAHQLAQQNLELSERGWALEVARLVAEGADPHAFRGEVLKQVHPMDVDVMDALTVMVSKGWRYPLEVVQRFVDCAGIDAADVRVQSEARWIAERRDRQARQLLHPVAKRDRIRV